MSPVLAQHNAQGC